MRVALVYPEVLDMARYRERRKEFPPFGVLYIAAALEESGIDVTIFKLEPESLEFDFRAFDAVGFSVSASATFNMFMECRSRSQFADGTLLMAGGVHANLYPEQTLLDLDVAVVGVGEGEDTVIEILRAWDRRDFSQVKGVCFRSNGQVIRTPTRTLSRNIDRFPFPARHLLDTADFIMGDRMSDTDILMTHLMPGRGCPFPCRYCASAQTRAQFRSGANIRAELVHLVENYGIKGFAVVGNDFILSKDNVYDICSEISDLNLEWATLSRVDRVDPKLLQVMRSAGCYELEYGVESGSQRILDAMDKRATVDQVRFAMRESFKAGIKSKVFLVHGYPGEDEESTDETIRLLDEVGKYIHRVSLFRFVPLPGTYSHTNAKSLGIHGTYGADDWDGDWGKFHIHHNHHHWWGTPQDFEHLTKSFWKLHAYVESRWPSKLSLAELPPDKWINQSVDFARNIQQRQLSSNTESEPLNLIQIERPNIR